MRIPALLLCMSITAADWLRYDTTSQLPRDARARLDRNLVVTGAGCERTQLRLDQLREPREAAIAGGELLTAGRRILQFCFIYFFLRPKGHIDLNRNPSCRTENRTEL